MELRNDGWLVLNIYVVRELVKGKIPVYNLSLQSKESESITEDFPFTVKDRNQNTLWGVVDLGNGQFKELVLRPSVDPSGLSHNASYSMSELSEEVDKSYVMD